VAIGYNSSVTGEDEVSIGNSSTETIGGYVNWTAASDGRFKENVEENVVGLEFINSLRPVTYNYNTDAIEEFYGRVVPEDLRASADKKNAIRFTGFIAQEVEKAANATGFDFSGVDAPSNEDQAYGIRYAEFVVPLVKATQELSVKADEQDELRAEVQALKEVVNSQNALLQQYQASLGQLQSEMNALKAQVDVKTDAFSKK